MTKNERVRIILRELKKLFPDAKIMLQYSSTWELLVAVILSAQCTDKMVNKITQTLFKKYRSLHDYAIADIKEFEKDIFSAGFYHTKAQHIIASAQIIETKFGGHVPKTMKEMISLPGVGRKTANVVLGNAYGIVEGIAVDTHVIRLSKVLGLTREIEPEKIEKALMKLLPKKEWLGFTYLLIEYGRKYCVAKKHDHTNCPLTHLLQ